MTTNERLQYLSAELLSVEESMESSLLDVMEASNNLAWELRMSDANRALMLSEQTYLRCMDAVTKIDPKDRFRLNHEVAQSLRTMGECEWRLSNYEGAMPLYKEAQERFREGKFLDGEAQCLNGIAIVMERLGDYKAALLHHEKSMKARQRIGDRRGVACSLMGMGIVYQYLGDYANSLEYHLKSLAIREEEDDRYGIASSYNQVGTVYANWGDTEKALEYFKKSLNLKQILQDRSGEATALSNIGDTHLKFGDTESALACYTKSFEIKRLLGDKQAEATALTGIGNVYVGMGDIKTAIRYYYESLGTRQGIGDKRGEAQALIDIAALYSKIPSQNLTEIELAENRSLIQDCLIRALELANELGAKTLLQPIYYALSISNEHAGNLAKALYCYKLFFEVKEELFGKSVEEKIRRLRLLGEIEKQEQEANFQRRSAEIYKIKTEELNRALKEAEEAKQIAQSANSAKSELLSIAAHDLKNPLQSIMGFSEIISESASADQFIHDNVEYIHQAAQRMFHLISEVLIASALEKGDIRLQKKRINLCSLASTVIAQNRSLASRKKQTIEFVSNEECIVIGDAERLFEVIDNLMSNAIKYSEKGKLIICSVTKTIRDHKQVVSFYVKDYGQGLTDADKSKLFQKFQQLSARPTNDENSTGLGLSIAKQFVDLHHGKIWAESEGQGKGSTFYVELAAAE